MARGFSPARTFERLLRGNGWIGLLAVLLLGLVFMQVHMLKLNAGISRAVESASTLERQNAQLRQEVSQLGAADRIEVAAGMFGMVMPQPGSVRYLDSREVAVDARRAVMTMTAPDPAAALAAGATALSATAPSTPAPDPATGPSMAANVQAPAAQPVPTPSQAASPAVETPAAPAVDPATAAPAAEVPAAAPAATATGGAMPGQP